MANKERIRFLLSQSSSRELTPHEKEELWSQLSDPENGSELNELLRSYWREQSFNRPGLDDAVKENILANILNRAVQPVKRYRFTLHWGVSLASVAALLLVIFGVFFISRKSEPYALQPTAKKEVIEPGKEKAILTLSDGSQVELDGAENGIPKESPVISQSKRGHLVYASATDGKLQSADKLEFHTVTTPHGGVYQVTLPDGTNVYLNSGSSLRYPTVFSSEKREVEVTGEMYFDVAKLISTRHAKGRVPFVVHTGGQRIEVLGTQFNVNAYSGAESIKTTLIEGSVNVHFKTPGAQKEEMVSLTPGFQAVNNFKRLNVRKINVHQAIAWKGGYFVFDNDNIKEIMRQLALWYDIDVSYEGNMKGKRFGGIFKKTKSIYQIMKNIEETGSVRFKVEERRVVVIAN